ncbi:MAG: hypothetical protein ACI9LV_000281 [Candidatus Nanohaloarchaea archaeon]|jgi:hypothetical protein
MKTSKLKELILETSEIRSIPLVAVAILLVTGVLLLELQTSEVRYNIDGKAELEHIEGNHLGNAIIYTESYLPVLIQEPDLEACIYSKNNRTPTILPVDTTEVLFTTSNIENLDIRLSIPRDKLDRNYPEGEVNLTLMEKCPLRGSSEIVLTEK